MESDNDEIDLGQLFRTIWRGKWFIAILLVLFGVLGFFYATKIAEPIYVATAIVAIDSSEPQATSLDALVGGLSAEQPSLNTEIYLIRSRQLLRRLVVAEDLTSDAEFNPQLAVINPYSIVGLRNMIFGPAPLRQYSDEELIHIAIDRLINKVTVTNPRQSFVFEIGVAAGSADKAALLANALALTYINDQLLVKEAQSQTAIEFLELRTFELQAELNEAELGAKDFTAQLEPINPSELIVMNREANELRDRMNALEAVVQGQELLSDLYLAFNLEDATTASIALLENRILSQLFPTIEQDQGDRTRFVDVLELEISRIQSDLAQSQMQYSWLAAAVLDLEEQVTAETQNFLTLQQLQREAEATGEIYGYFLTRLKEAEVQQGTQQADGRILSAAVVPGSASSPRVLIIIFLAGILGAFLGISLVLLRELNKGSIRTAADLQSLTGHSVLGQIQLAPFRRRNKLIPFLQKKTNTPFSESIRNLRTSLLLAKSETEPCVILMTSSVSGEGKTTTAVALAHSLAGMGKSVLLMEGDVRKKVLSQHFNNVQLPKTKRPSSAPMILHNSKIIFDGLESEVILSGKIEKSVLLMEREARKVIMSDHSGSMQLETIDQPGSALMIIPDSKTTGGGLGFDVMISDQMDEHPADFFSSEKFNYLISEVRKTYDHVIIDAPPVLAVTDARIIGKHSDAILFAVVWDETRIMTVEAGLAEISNSGLSITGLVLTKVNGKKAKRYGGAARYGSYYGEYSKSY